MKTTYGQQAAAAARKGDHDNAAALYTRAALEAEKKGAYSRARAHFRKAYYHDALEQRRKESA